MLIMTGDQIYADDVADSLLYMIMDASRTLLCRDELMPDGRKVAEIHPGTRTAIVREIGVTSGMNGHLARIPRSHMLSLGEYLVMYLFIWADVLWDVELPGFDDVFLDKNLNIYRVPGKISSEHVGRYGEYYVRTDDSPEFTKFTNQELPAVGSFKKDLVDVRRALATFNLYDL